MTDALAQAIEAARVSIKRGARVAEACHHAAKLDENRVLEHVAEVDPRVRFAREPIRKRG